MQKVPRANILGVGVSAINMALALEIIEGWIERRDFQYVCVTGVHGVMESQRDEELRRIHNRAGLVTPDGMPLVWLSRLQGFRHVERVYGPDLMLALCERSAAKGYRHSSTAGRKGSRSNWPLCFRSGSLAYKWRGPFPPSVRSLRRRMIGSFKSSTRPLRILSG